MYLGRRRWQARFACKWAKKRRASAKIAGSAVAARAENAETTTVRSLLARDLAVVGAIPNPAGPGSFLQKKGDLVLCFVAETRTSENVATPNVPLEVNRNGKSRFSPLL